MKALILIDLQNDFMPGGALAIPNADQILPMINKILPLFESVIATKDWHPENHISFSIWPKHCIQNTKGAEFPKKLHVKEIEHVIYKGMDPNIDSYSAFFDNEKKHQTGLFEYLKRKKITHLYFVGVATDYCVLYSVLDALELGFQVTVVQDGCRGIKEEAKAFETMRQKGAHLLSFSDL